MVGELHLRRRSPKTEKHSLSPTEQRRVVTRLNCRTRVVPLWNIPYIENREGNMVNDLITAAASVVTAYDILHQEVNNLNSLQLRTRIEYLRKLLTEHTVDIDAELTALRKDKSWCDRIHKCIVPPKPVASSDR